MSTRWRSVANSLLDLLYPPCCASCGRVDTRWCSSCDAKLRALPLAIQLRKLPPLVKSGATGTHEGILQSAVHALKYENTTAPAGTLALRLADTVRTTNWTFDMIIPVPIHAARMKERGYNQSQVIGTIMAELTHIPLTTTALHRSRNTPSQVGLNLTARAHNVHEAFVASPEHVTNSTILLIDDVMTTGATLQECATALLNAGALHVYSLAVSAAKL